MHYPKLFALVFMMVVALHSRCRETDSVYIKRLTDSLASPAMAGRGYLRQGLQKAAKFIQSELASMGVASQQQVFTMPVNTFPGKVALSINGTALTPGKDFLVMPQSRGIKARGSLVQADSNTWVNASHQAMFQTTAKLSWSVAAEQEAFTGFQVLQSAWPDKVAKFSAEVEAKTQEAFEAANILATIKGTEKPDSMVVFTAHYDHLGMMGQEALFAGANDNAAGAAMLLALAKFYQQQPARYSVAFLFFAGEEAGLLGSKYFVENPLFPLAPVRFLINLDLVGNGDEGITVVNATEFPNDFEWLKQCNERGRYLVAVNSRGKARNSDHYWFTERGVPSFFIYTLGKRKAYHDVDDVPATVSHPEANDLVALMKAFVLTLQGLR